MNLLWFAVFVAALQTTQHTVAVSHGEVISPDNTTTATNPAHNEHPIAKKETYYNCEWSEGKYNKDYCTNTDRSTKDYWHLSVLDAYSDVTLWWRQAFWDYDGEVTTNAVWARGLNILKERRYFRYVNVSYIMYQLTPTLDVIEDGSVACIDNYNNYALEQHVFVGRSVEIPAKLPDVCLSEFPLTKVQISDEWFRYTTKTANTDVCTTSMGEGGFDEEDCKTHYVDPSYVDLVANHTYNNDSAVWRNVFWNVRQAERSGTVRVATTGDTTVSTDSFYFTSLNTKTLHLQRTPTFGVIDEGSVGAVDCPSCQFGPFYFLAREGLAVSNGLEKFDVGNGYFRVTQPPSLFAQCTHNSAGFEEWDCAKGLVDPSLMTLVVNSMFKTSDWWLAIDYYAYNDQDDVSFKSKTFSIGREWFGFKALEAEILNLNTFVARGYIETGTIGSVECWMCGSNDVLFVGKSVTAGGDNVQKIPIGNSHFRITKRTEHTSACTVKSGADTFDEFDCERTMAGEEDWVDFAQMELLADCTGADDCTVKKNVSTAAFGRLAVVPPASAVTFAAPVIVRELVVEGTFDGAFVVTGTLSFVVREGTLSRLDITARDGVALTVTDADGEVLTATETPLFLFAGSVDGDVGNLRGAACGATTYWAYTSEGSVACACWVKDESLAGGYVGNWCGAEFALGVRKDLVFDADSAYTANGIVFGTDSVTLTTTDGREYTIEVEEVDAPDTLVVGAGVLLTAATISAGRVLDIATLSTGATRVVQRNGSLAVTIGRLAGRVVFEGKGVTASIGACTGDSAVTVNGTATVSTRCGVRLDATEGSAVALGGSAVTIDSAAQFTLTGAGFSALVVRAAVALRDARGVLTGTASSALALDVGDGADVVVAGDGCDVSLGAKGGLAPVSFVSSSPCRGLRGAPHAQRSASRRTGLSAPSATPALRSGLGAR